MPDYVLAHKIETFARIGCTAEERSFPQRLLISVRLDVDTRRAAKTKDLSHTVNYAAVCEQVRSTGASQPWVLVEELAETLSEKIFESSPLIQSARITIEKFVLPGVDWVGVEIFRER